MPNGTPPNAALVWVPPTAVFARFPDRVADDWSTGVDHGGLWPAKLVACKYHVVEGARRIVKGALDVVGGGAIFKTNELERLLRDVTLGTIHPASSPLTHEVVGKSYLGLLGQPPRWG